MGVDTAVEHTRRGTILAALHEVMSEIKGVPKDGTNEFHRYKFVSEAGLVEAVRPVLLKHGLFLMGPHIRENQVIGTDLQGVTTFVVEYELAHVSGAVWPERFSVVAQGCDRDSKGNWGDKGCYKAHTGAHKYLLLRLLNLVTGMEPEDDSAGQRTERDEGQRTRAPSKPKESSEKAKGIPGTINSDIARDAGIYREAFAAAEKVYGKEKVKADQAKRFAPIDFVVSQLGFRKLSEIPATPENLTRIKAGITRWGAGGADEPDRPEQYEYEDAGPVREE